MAAGNHHEVAAGIGVGVEDGVAEGPDPQDPVVGRGRAARRDATEDAVAGVVEAAGIDADVEDGAAPCLRPDSVSRFSRFRSPRRSAADW